MVRYATLEVFVKDLLPGDWVVPAQASVKEVQLFAGILAIVDFEDNTATPPVPRFAKVQIFRGDQKIS